MSSFFMLIGAIRPAAVARALGWWLFG